MSCRLFGLIAFATLSACADLPDVSPVRGDLVAPEGYPELLPLSGILTSTTQAPADPDAAERLQARAAGIGNTSISQPNGGLDPQRIAALRRRADALRGDASDIEALRAGLVGL